MLEEIGFETYCANWKTEGMGGIHFDGLTNSFIKDYKYRVTIIIYTDFAFNCNPCIQGGGSNNHANEQNLAAGINNYTVEFTARDGDNLFLMFTAGSCNVYFGEITIEVIEEPTNEEPTNEVNITAEMMTEGVTIDGTPIFEAGTVREVEYNNILVMHPLADGDAYAIFNVENLGYTTFKALIGKADGMAYDTIFRVYVDDVLVFEQGKDASEALTSIEIDITNANIIKLAVGAGTTYAYGTSLWVNPVFVK